MSTRFYSLVFDAADPPALAAWWAQALDWRHRDLPDESQAGPAAQGDPGLWLVFVPVEDPKTAKNRVHLDLRSESAADQRAIVDRLRMAGARLVDVGQRDVPWVVLADPEGNEFCVLEPRPEYAQTGPVAAVVLDVVDPRAQGEFWAAASGWDRVRDTPEFVSFRDGETGPYLELLRVGEPHAVKNRVHLDVAPRATDEQASEVDRLVGLGARPVEVGQAALGERLTWVVLADPEGNEFCVLSPRD